VIWSTSIPVRKTRCLQTAQNWVSLYIEILRIGEEAARKQEEVLAALRECRNGVEVERLLTRLGQGARADENLMPAMLDAVCAYATLSEIRATLEAVYGRFQEPASF